LQYPVSAPSAALRRGGAGAQALHARAAAQACGAERARALGAGVMFQKDGVAPGRMRRKIRRPRILLLDCPLEYKKGENQTNVELTREEDWRAP